MSIMLTVLMVAAMICVVLYLRYCYSEGMSIFFVIPLTLLVVMLILMVSMLLVFGASMIPIGAITTEDSLESTIELVALNDKTTLEGAMYGGIFITRGYIDTIPTYAYYYKAENGSIKFGQIPADSTSIYYILDDSLPRIETYHRTESGNTLYHFPTKYTQIVDVYYKLYIPKDAISPDIRLDLDS